MILLATRNPGKIREIRSILSSLPIQLASLLDFENILPIVEDGITYKENAKKKAYEVFHATKIPTIADDSGLEVEILGMQPGIFSAYYAGESADYSKNNQKLLEVLKGVPPEQRKAQFRCVALYFDGNFEKYSEGICSGVIAQYPKGNGGFGYDPIFIPDGYSQTFGELPEAIKNVISHRAKAFIGIKNFLKIYLKI